MNKCHNLAPYKDIFEPVDHFTNAFTDITS